MAKILLDTNICIYILNNKPIHIKEEYERMKELSEYIEQKEIYDIVQQRLENRKTPAKYLSQDEMLGMINQKLKTL